MINEILAQIRDGKFDYIHKPTHISRVGTTISSPEYLQKMDEAKENREWNRQAEAGVRNSFRKTLAQAYGVSEHPKEERLWELAWSKGHANGYAEVALEYDELVTLIT